MWMSTELRSHALPCATTRRGFHAARGWQGGRVAHQPSSQLNGSVGGWVDERMNECGAAALGLYQVGGWGDDNSSQVRSYLNGLLQKDIHTLAHSHVCG
jgi:hypothetical protein